MNIDARLRKLEDHLLDTTTDPEELDDQAEDRIMAGTATMKDFFRFRDETFQRAGSGELTRIALAYLETTLGAHTLHKDLHHIGRILRTPIDEEPDPADVAQVLAETKRPSARELRKLEVLHPDLKKSRLEEWREMCWLLVRMGDPTAKEFRTDRAELDRRHQERMAARAANGGQTGQAQAESVPE